jgi:hypothetical protein
VEDHRSTADGAGNFITGGEIFPHWSFMHSMVECSLDADQHMGKKALCAADRVAGPYIRSMLMSATLAARKAATASSMISALKVRT